MESNPTEWKPGDIAVCINNKTLPGYTTIGAPPLRLKSEYIVNKCFICECGAKKLDVGLFSENGTNCRCGSSSASHI